METGQTKVKPYDFSITPPNLKFLGPMTPSQLMFKLGGSKWQACLLSKVKAGSHCSSPRPRDYSRGMHAHTRIARINTCMYISAWIPRARDN